MNPYMYTFIRNDLSHNQQIVQTAHAVDMLNKKHPHDYISHMVLCDVQNEDELIGLSEWLTFRGICHTMFHEPDINAYTAIATKPLIGVERSPMKKFSTKK